MRSFDQRTGSFGRTSAMSGIVHGSPNRTRSSDRIAMARVSVRCRSLANSDSDGLYAAVVPANRKRTARALINRSASGKRCLTDLQAAFARRQNLARVQTILRIEQIFEIANHL